MKKKLENNITLCNGCNCATKSIRKGRAHFVCDKCGYNKTLGDCYQYELQERIKKQKEELTNRKSEKEQTK